MSTTAKARTPHSSCPRCGKALKEATEVQTIRYGEKNPARIVTEGPVFRCVACGFAFTDWRMEDIREVAIQRYHLGLLNPYEIRVIRKRIGSQIEVARLTGMSERSLIRWENGTLIQSRSADRFLRLLDAKPALLKVLRHIAAQHPS